MSKRVGAGHTGAADPLSQSDGVGAGAGAVRPAPPADGPASAAASPRLVIRGETFSSDLVPPGLTGIDRRAARSGAPNFGRSVDCFSRTLGP